MGYLGKIASGGWSLIVGVGITARELGRTLFRRKAVTLQYPHEKPELSPNFRSAIKLIRFDETNSHDCVACLACERICPSFCIKIEGGRVDGIKKKRASDFHMDFALCSLCGLCIDACPTTTLEYSKIYDPAGYDRDWNFDLLEEFKGYEEQFVAEQKEREDKEAEEKKQAAAAKKAAAAKAKAAKEAKAKAKEADVPKADEDKPAKAKADKPAKTKADKPAKAKADKPAKANAEPKANAAPEPNAEPKANAAPEPKANAAPEPNAEVKAKAEPEANAEPSGEAS